jgi:hypothetical protein
LTAALDLWSRRTGFPFRQIKNRGILFLFFKKYMHRSVLLADASGAFLWLSGITGPMSLCPWLQEVDMHPVRESVPSGTALNQTGTAIGDKGP